MSFFVLQRAGLDEVSIAGGLITLGYGYRGEIYTLPQIRSMVFSDYFYVSTRGGITQPRIVAVGNAEGLMGVGTEGCIGFMPAANMIYFLGVGRSLPSLLAPFSWHCKS